MKKVLSKYFLRKFLVFYELIVNYIIFQTFFDIQMTYKLHTMTYFGVTLVSPSNTSKNT